MAGSPSARIIATVTLIALMAVMAPSVMAGDRAAELIDRYTKHRQEMVERLETYAQARQRAEAALDRAEKAVVLARELDDEQALQIATRAKINAEAALNRVLRFQAHEQDRLRRFDHRRQLLIDARRVEYVSRFKGTVARTGGKELDAPLAPGDTLTTGHDGFVEISFLGGASMTLGPNTTLRLLEADEVTYHQARGTIYHIMRCLKSRDACRHRRLTPGGAIAVRGTAFETEVDDAGNTTVRTFEGKVAFIPAKKGMPQVEIFAGRQATIDKDGRVSGRRKDTKAKASWWDF